MSDWLTAARADAERRGLPELTPLLETLARSTAALREADRIARRDGLYPPDSMPPAPAAK